MTDDPNASTVTRDDPRYLGSEYPEIVLRAWHNFLDMGGWTDFDVEAFEAAIRDELKWNGRDPLTEEYPDPEEIEIEPAGDLAVVMEWFEKFGDYGALAGKPWKRPRYKEELKQALASDDEEVREAALRLLPLVSTG